VLLWRSLNIFAAPFTHFNCSTNKTMTLSTIESQELYLNDSAHSASAGTGIGNGSVSGKGSGDSTTKEGKSQRSYGAGMPDTILTARERQIMRMSRITVLVILLLVAATATVLMWYLTTKWEKADLETKVRINQSINQSINR
jgi:hypothetical protein